MGRRSERAALAAVADGARSGRGGAVVIRGGHGSGKTHLLDEAVAGFTDSPVFRVTGVEIEAGLPFGALQQLCGQLGDRVAGLPAPQAAALAGALGLAPGEEADPALVGLGLVSLLAGVASETGKPVLCVLDDVEWIDESSVRAIGVAARRVAGAAIALLLASGAAEPTAALAGLEEVRLHPLSPGEAHLMLDLELPGRLDAEVRQRILAEAHGSPGVIRQVGRALTVPALAGGFAVDAAGDVDADLDLEVRACLTTVPDEVVTALVVAAAEPWGEVSAFRQGCSAAGLPEGVEHAVETTGLVGIGDRVLFSHPLARHLVYHGASDAHRRAAHRALAESLRPGPRGDRVVWHRALSGAGPDEEVAEMLEQWSVAVGRTGGVAAAAAFLERAALLSADPRAQVRRAIGAARLLSRSGGFDDALRLIAEIEHRDAGCAAQAIADLTAAEIGAWTGDPDAAGDLLDAAARIAVIEPERSVTARLAAFDAVTSTGRVGAAGGLHHVATRAGWTTATNAGGGAAERLLQASVARWGTGVVPGRDTLARALDTWCADESVAHPFATRIAMDLLDERAWATLARRDVDHARTTGAFAGLPRALDLLACLCLWRADLDGAAAASEEAANLARRFGAAAPALAPTLLGSWRGASGDASDCANGSTTTLIDLGQSLVQIASGRYEAALRDAQRVLDLDEPFLSSWAAPQVVEAAVRAGRPEQAATAIELVRSIGCATGSSWARGIEHRCLALLADPHAAEEHFRESVRQLELSGMSLDLARTQLLYGEWLRRQTRRVDSRTPLRQALDVFDAAGAAAFAKRAWLELRASGEQARRRTPETLGALTERESQVAELAIEGHSNPAIGKQLFISPRTVEYHLNKVFSKVGITSRTQLRAALGR